MERSFTLPDLGEGVHEGEVLAILVSVGDAVKEGDPVLEVETDKAAVEIPSPITGRVVAVHVKPGDVVRVGEALITFEEAGKTEAAPEKARASAPSKEADKDQGGKKGKTPVPASPSTRRKARELGVDINLVTPSGPSGLVTAEDVAAFAEKSRNADPEVEKTRAAAPEKPDQEPVEIQMTPPAKLEPAKSRLPDFTAWGPVERVPVRSIRKATARQMARSWSQIPHVTNHNSADVTELELFRQEYKKEIEDAGGRLTLTVFAMKALVTALKAYPKFNASLDTESWEIVLKQYYHIGVAVDTVDGLIVPIIRDVDRKSIMEIAIELNELVQRTRARENTPEESRGGTFTITNVGNLDSGHFVPIINTPEVGIFGMGSARMEPVVMEKERGGFKIVPRLMMPLVLAIDHRVLDGADAMRFMNVIKSGLEDPERLFITMS